MIVFVRSYLSELDGRMIKYFDALKHYGIDFIFIGWSRKNSHDNKKNNEIIFNKSASIGGGWRNALNIILWNFFIFYSLFKNRSKIEAVHSVDLDSSIPAYLFCRLFGKKLIFDIYDKYTAVRNITGLVGKLIDYIERYIAINTDLTLLAGEDRYEQLQIPRFQKNCLVLENVPMVSIKPSLAVPEYDRVWKIGYFGVLEPNHRGLEDLMEMASARDDVELHLVGYGGLEEYVKNFAFKHDNIKFHGAMTSEAGLKIMAEMHIVAGLYYLSIPNHAYAAPNKYYEHLMLGRGLLTTKNTSPGRKVEHFSTGWAVEEGKTALVRWANDLKIDAVQNCSTAASALWESHYKNYYCENYIKIYGARVQAIIENGRNAP